LGWTPEITLNTPIPQIILAMEGKYDFAMKTNPFGAKPKPKPNKKREAKLEAQRSKFALLRLEAKQHHKDKACQTQ